MKRVKEKRREGKEEKGGGRGGAPPLELDSFTPVAESFPYTHEKTGLSFKLLR